MSQYYHLKPPDHISIQMLNVQPSFFLTEISSVSLKSLKITAFHWKCQISFYTRVKICFYPAQESKSRGLSIDKHFLCSNYQHQSDKLTVLYSYTPQLCKLGARGQMVTSQVWQHVTLTRPHKSERMASHTRSLLFLVSCSGWGPCDSERIHMGMSEAGKPHFLVVKLFNFILVTAFILKDDIWFFFFVCLDRDAFSPCLFTDCIKWRRYHYYIYLLHKVFRKTRGQYFKCVHFLFFTKNCGKLNGM